MANLLACCANDIQHPLRDSSDEIQFLQLRGSASDTAAQARECAVLVMSVIPHAVHGPGRWGGAPYTGGGVVTPR